MILTNLSVVTWEINDCLFPILKKLFYFLFSFIAIPIYYCNISIFVYIIQLMRSIKLLVSQ